MTTPPHIQANDARNTLHKFTLHTPIHLLVTTGSLTSSFSIACIRCFRYSSKLVVVIVAPGHCSRITRNIVNNSPRLSGGPAGRRTGRWCDTGGGGREGAEGRGVTPGFGSGRKLWLCMMMKCASTDGDEDVSPQWQLPVDLSDGDC